MTDPAQEGKSRAGRHAAGYVEDGMRVGLGTGSTIDFTMVALAERGADVRCVATSERTRARATQLGLRVFEPDAIGRLDIAIDGADEIDPQLNLIKGGGGAHTREKIVAQMADRFLVIADESKLVAALGAFGLPLEVLPFAPKVLAQRVRALGAQEVTVRPERSDNGNLLLDARFGTIPEPAVLARRLEAIPGLLEHGLFLGDTVERAILGNPEGVREIVAPR